MSIMATSISSNSPWKCMLSNLGSGRFKDLEMSHGDDLPQTLTLSFEKVSEHGKIPVFSMKEYKKPGAYLQLNEGDGKSSASTVDIGLVHLVDYANKLKDLRINFDTKSPDIFAIKILVNGENARDGDGMVVMGQLDHTISSFRLADLVSTYRYDDLQP
jgi:hypothetical protein